MSTEKPVTARRLATQKRLLSAARDVVAERGLAGASVVEICDRAGFTRGAFYSNYSTKDDLVVALIQDLAQRRKEAMISRVATSTLPSFEEACRFGIDVFFGDISELDADVLLVTELQLWAIRNPGTRKVHAAMVADTITFVGAAFDAFLAAYGASYRTDRVTAIQTMHAALDYHRLRSVLGAEDRDQAKQRLVELMAVLVDVPEQG